MKSRFPKHVPFHLYLDDNIYFVTSSTLKKLHFFDTDDKKEILRGRLKASAEKYAIRLYAWVVLSNHYHLLLQLKNSETLPAFIAFINGGSSFELNAAENKKGRQIWWNYWDNCIRDKKTFYKRFNYIHHNPVKHNYAKQCEGYQFSSYNHYVKKLGRDYIDSIFAEYPIIDFTDKYDDL